MVGKKLLIVLLSLIALKASAQTSTQTRVMYPADRCNRIFISGLTTGITYSVSYALFNQKYVKRKHLYPILTTVGVNMALGAVSYAFDRSSQVNKRQNITGWFGGTVVTIAVIRIGLGK